MARSFRYVHYTRFLSPHETPLFDAAAELFEQAVYVTDEETPADPARPGWKWTPVRGEHIVLSRFPKSERVAVLKSLVGPDTLVLCGVRDTPYWNVLLDSGARVCYVGERWLRPRRWLPGMLRLLNPRFVALAWRMVRRLERPNFHLLPQGVHAAVDLARLVGLFHGDLRCLWRSPKIEVGQGVARDASVTRMPGESVDVPNFPILRNRMSLWGYFVPASSQSSSHPITQSPNRTIEQSNNRTITVPPLCLLWAGRMIYWKHVETIVEAVRGLVKRGVTVRLTLMGDGPERASLEAHARGLPVEFRPFGTLAEVRAEMRAHDVYVLSSDAEEGWGVVVNEALGEGLPVLATHESGAGATLLPEESLFHAGDVERLVELLAATRDASVTRIGRWTPANAARRLVDLVEKPWMHENELIAASFWEEHCTECGEPECYRTCPKFERAWHGRCRRLEDASGGFFFETIRGVGGIRFRTWGKLELLFHGGMVSWKRAERLEGMHRRLLGFGRLLPRLYRSLRWRWSLRGSERMTPNLWRVCCQAERETRLVASVVDCSLIERARWVMKLPAGEERSFEWLLPPIVEGTLFRIHPLDGEETGCVEFLENSVVRVPQRSGYVKCLAWDLDGTLWDGTLEEDGEEGLTLREESVALLRNLDARGIVNSIVSRNNPKRTLDVLRRFGLEEYFVFPQIGWGAKSEGVKRLAREMNISLDAVAFVDDRAEQRADVRTNVPEVRVFSNVDISRLGSMTCFNPPVSSESASRRQSYRTEMVRRQAAEQVGDEATFLAQSGLEISCFDLKTADTATWTRCMELMQRSNQLNLTGRHVDEAAFRASLSDGEGSARAWGVRCHDKYGDYGIVGVMLAREEKKNVWRLAEFVMSCRVARKGCEGRALDWLKRTLGADELLVEIVDTGRNGALREALADWRGV